MQKEGVRDTPSIVKPRRADHHSYTAQPWVMRSALYDPFIPWWHPIFRRIEVFLLKSRSSKGTLLRQTQAIGDGIIDCSVPWRTSR